VGKDRVSCSGEIRLTQLGTYPATTRVATRVRHRVTCSGTTRVSDSGKVLGNDSGKESGTTSDKDPSKRLGKSLGKVIRPGKTV
jgi:hypothetical protein